ncbi:endonuclease/exonuclease/phosphatase family protein [Pseudaestuariivita rosea]|uniref:endonuclease/exonuclease/phosphatase family protein n=1 Tax=Pseudaestuariivita rosea TaxID=2763263 RepID=UPI001ABB51EE
MRIATYNVEWFNTLFDDAGQLLPDGEWSGRQNVTRMQQIEALGIVFTALDADAIMVIEAPDSSRKRSGEVALESFAAAMGLRARKALIGFQNDTQQEIALLYDPEKLTARHDPWGTETGKKGSEDAPRFDGVFRIDLNIDDMPEKISFSKPPLELAVTTKDGFAFRMIGVHTKSKAPNGARNAADVTRLAIANRRKQLAQCIWIRHRIDEHIAADNPLIVLGDLNDGPGLDSFEELFGRSGVEIVLGEGEGALFDPHARQALSQRIAARPTTARFYLAEQKRYLEALLDYIMISRPLRPKAQNWRIWHPFDDQVCYTTPELRDALIIASDHFPVTLDIDL